jgi:hypothetical protein
MITGSVTTAWRCRLAIRAKRGEHDHELYEVGRENFPQVAPRVAGSDRLLLPL